MEKIKSLTTKKSIKQSNKLNRAKFELSALSLDILNLFISQVQSEDPSFVEYAIPLYEVEKKLQKRVNRGYIESAMLELLNNDVFIEDSKLMKFAEISSYDEKLKIVNFKFSEDLSSHLLRVRNNFVVGNFAIVSKLKSAYAKRIYMLLKQFKTTGFLTIFTEELYRILSVEKKYGFDFFEFKRKVLEIAKKQMSESDLTFAYKEIKVKRKIIRIEFKIINLEKKHEPQFKKKVKIKSGIQALDNWLKNRLEGEEEFIDTDIVS